jgi:hypothetical protein
MSIENRCAKNPPGRLPGFCGMLTASLIDIAVFRAGAPGHALQDFKQNLPLVRHGNAMRCAQSAEPLCFQSIH